ncbi:MAG: glycosyl transferase [Segetibacter sp.]|nr:glycosyl transferase [Segetibacter sp.]
MRPFEKYFPYFLLAGILINANGLFIDILEPDGALYATIAKHITLTNDWVNLFGDGHDWLDKPHFPFWVTAASFKLFGITAFAYKVPAFIFWLAGIWFLYVLAKELQNNYTAKVAVIVYIFSLHGLLNNFDVRAEPYLTALSIAAIYYFYKAHLYGKIIHVVLAAFMAACAVMTKGIFVLVTIGGGYVIYWAVTRQWKQFVNYKWWVMVVLILLFITPEIYSLYTQFDLHPEKVVFGKTNVSGVKFFFWDSQFGRFFNTGPIKGHGDPGFFLHTTLWAFLPWSVILYIAVVRLFLKGKRAPHPKRWIIYGSAAITFLLFSLSGFQLPHYVVILFPHFSIIVADYLTSVNKENTFKRIRVLQTVLLVLGAISICLLAYYSKFGNVFIIAIITAALVIVTITAVNKTEINSIIARGIAFSLVLFVFLYNFFYPRLLEYQAGMMAGKWLQQNAPTASSALFKSWSYSFEFYAPGFVETINDYGQLDQFLRKNTTTGVYTTANTLEELKQKGYEYIISGNFSFFHISMLTGSFINPATREKALEKMVLITGVRKTALH